MDTRFSRIMRGALVLAMGSAVLLFVPGVSGAVAVQEEAAKSDEKPTEKGTITFVGRKGGVVRVIDEDGKVERIERVVPIETIRKISVPGVNGRGAESEGARSGSPPSRAGVPAGDGQIVRRRMLAPEDMPPPPGPRTRRPARSRAGDAPDRANSP